MVQGFLFDFGTYHCLFKMALESCSFDGDIG